MVVAARGGPLQLPGCEGELAADVVSLTETSDNVHSKMWWHHALQIRCRHPLTNLVERTRCRWRGRRMRFNSGCSLCWPMAGLHERGVQRVNCMPCAGSGLESSRRRDCHLMAPPCTFIMCFNRDINRGCHQHDRTLADGQVNPAGTCVSILATRMYQVRPPTTLTILEQDGPNHLVL